MLKRFILKLKPRFSVQVKKNNQVLVNFEKKKIYIYIYISKIEHKKPLLHQVHNIQ